MKVKDILHNQPAFCNQVGCGENSEKREASLHIGPRIIRPFTLFFCYYAIENI